MGGCADVCHCSGDLHCQDEFGRPGHQDNVGPAAICPFCFDVLLLFFYFLVYTLIIFLSCFFWLVFFCWYSTIFCCLLGVGLFTLHHHLHIYPPERSVDCLILRPCFLLLCVITFFLFSFDFISFILPLFFNFINSHIINCYIEFVLYSIIGVSFYPQFLPVFIVVILFLLISYNFPFSFVAVLCSVFLSLVLFLLFFKCVLFLFTQSLVIWCPFSHLVFSVFCHFSSSSSFFIYLFAMVLLAPSFILLLLWCCFIWMSFWQAALVLGCCFRLIFSHQDETMTSSKQRRVLLSDLTNKQRSK